MENDRCMVASFSAFAHNIWSLVAQMAPYLLFGFAVAGILHILIRPERVQRLLGKPGLGAVLKACLVGVPMPLCSCAVIPVAASLRKSGASRGATAAFLSSTPQTGVDSILATYALMGGLFTAVRVFVAFVSGILSGFLIELFCNDTAKPAAPTASVDKTFSFTPLSKDSETSAPTFSNLSLTTVTTPAATSNCCASSPARPGLGKGLRYGFVNLPADLAVAITIGLILAGLITTLLPADLISGSFSSGPLAFLLVTLISLPLYVCATASIPMAYALMAAGLSPGAALIFLITGPATNTATIVTVWKMLGRKATLIYLGCLLVVSWLAGWLFNSALSQASLGHSAHQHEALQPALWEHAAAVVLILILIGSYWTMRKTKAAKSNTKSCCT
jgi:uncharacterized membrane protein YraQ (UPF0718 family)